MLNELLTLPESYARLLQADIRDFITLHAGTDVPALALKKPPAQDWPYALVMDQIKARQKAQEKRLLWGEANMPEGFLWPPSELIEQASCGPAAHYKAVLATEYLANGLPYADVTAGLGSDLFRLAQTVTHSAGYGCDIQPLHAALLKHNANILGLAPRLTIECKDAAETCTHLSDRALVYIDPQRRHDGRKGFVKFQACSPDVLKLLQIMPERQAVVIKASPMMDIEEGLRNLEGVRPGRWQAHVLEWRGECREILFIRGVEDSASARITAVILDDEGSVFRRFDTSKEQEAKAAASISMPMSYLFEPGPAVMKTGGFKTLSALYGAAKLHPQTHLYTSEADIKDFPGRRFRIQAIHAPEARLMRHRQGHLTVRNFPEHVENIRKKLGLKDGGDVYYFACRLMDGRYVLVETCKADGNA